MNNTHHHEWKFIVNEKREIKEATVSVPTRHTSLHSIMIKPSKLFSLCMSRLVKASLD